MFVQSHIQRQTLVLPTCTIPSWMTAYLFMSQSPWFSIDLYLSSALYTSDPPLQGTFTSLKIYCRNSLFSPCCVARKLGSQTPHLLVGAEAINAPGLPWTPVSSSALIRSPSYPTQRKERWWKNSAAKSCYLPLLLKKTNSRKNRNAHSCHMETKGRVCYYCLCHYTTCMWA